VRGGAPGVAALPGGNRMTLIARSERLVKAANCLLSEQTTRRRLGDTGRCVGRAWTRRRDDARERRSTRATRRGRSGPLTHLRRGAVGDAPPASRSCRRGRRQLGRRARAEHGGRPDQLLLPGDRADPELQRERATRTSTSTTSTRSRRAGQRSSCSTGRARPAGGRSCSADPDQGRPGPRRVPADALREGWLGDVEYVPSSENRSQGAVLGHQLAGLCNGVRVQYVWGP
jgi:hypothetical protein